MFPLKLSSKSFDNPSAMGRIHGGGKINVARLVANVGWFLVAPEAVREVHACHGCAAWCMHARTWYKISPFIFDRYSLDSRGQITRSVIRPPNRSPLLSPSLFLLLSLYFSLLFFFTKLTVISEISISSLLCGCVGVAGLHVEHGPSHRESRRHHRSHPAPPTPCPLSPFFQPVLRVFARHHET